METVAMIKLLIESQCWVETDSKFNANITPENYS